MSYTTFSQVRNDQLQEPMFFGQPVNVALSLIHISEPTRLSL